MKSKSNVNIRIETEEIALPKCVKIVLGIGPPVMAKNVIESELHILSQRKYILQNLLRDADEKIDKAEKKLAELKFDEL